MRAASAKWRSRTRGAHAMLYDGPLQLLVRRLARALYLLHAMGPHEPLSAPRFGERKRGARKYTTPISRNAIPSTPASQTSLRERPCSNATRASATSDAPASATATPKTRLATTNARANQPWRCSDIAVPVKKSAIGHTLPPNAAVQRRRADLTSAPRVHNEMTRLRRACDAVCTVRCNCLLGAGGTVCGALSRSPECVHKPQVDLHFRIIVSVPPLHEGFRHPRKLSRKRFPIESDRANDLILLPRTKFLEQLGQVVLLRHGLTRLNDNCFEGELNGQRGANDTGNKDYWQQPIDALTFRKTRSAARRNAADCCLADLALTWS